MVLKRLKVPKLFNGVTRTYPTHKHMGFGRGGRNLKISAKNAVFLISSGKKTNFTTFGHHRKILEKSTDAGKWKISFLRPCTQA